MRQQQGGYNLAYRQIDQSDNLACKQQDDTNDTKRPQPRITHDFQHPLRLHGTTKTITDIGKTIFVQGTRQVNAGGCRQQHSQRGRQTVYKYAVEGGTQDCYQQTNEGEITCGMPQPV